MKELSSVLTVRILNLYMPGTIHEITVPADNLARPEIFISLINQSFHWINVNRVESGH